MVAFIFLLLSAILDHSFQPPSPEWRCPFPDGTRMEVWCPPVPETWHNGAWVPVVLRGNEMHVNGKRTNGFMPIAWLEDMPVRFPQQQK